MQFKKANIDENTIQDIKEFANNASGETSLQKNKKNKKKRKKKEEEEKEKKCIQEDITETRKFLIAYAFVCIILLCIIIFLCLAIYHLRKGENYYCIKMKHGNLVETSQPQLNDVEAIDISEPKVEVELANTNPQN